MTKEEAEKFIQKKLAEITSQFEEIRKVSDEHGIEFSFLGSTMHYMHPSAPTGRPFEYLDRPAKTGFFVADDLWQSSNFWCSPHKDAVSGLDFEEWQQMNWPEDYDPPEDDE